METTYSVSFFDGDGVEHEVDADSVEGIAEQLREIAEYARGVPNVEVRSVNGELRGWAHADGSWRCA